MFDLIIIGAGPTGISCGIEAKKAGLNYLILEKGMLVNSIFHFPANMTFFSTSQLLEIGEIPFISHGDKPTRREALEYYRRVLDYYQMNIRFYEKVDQIKPVKGFYQIETNKSGYQTHSVIVSTGYYDTPRLLNVPGENLSKVKHYYDDAHHYIGQKVLVIGAANSACDVALETWMKGAEVTMAVREPGLYKKVKYWILPNIENRIKEGSIKAYFNTEVKEIKEGEVILESAGNRFSVENDYVLAMTGYKPDYPLLDKFGIQTDESEDRKPVLDPTSLESNLPNVYVAGVLNAGMNTSKLFIENTRHHGKLIIKKIKSRLHQMISSS